MKPRIFKIKCDGKVVATIVKPERKAGLTLSKTSRSGPKVYFDFDYNDMVFFKKAEPTRELGAMPYSQVGSNTHKIS